MDSFADLMPSRFFKTEDVTGTPIKLTINAIEREEVKFQGKNPEKVTVIKFNETERQMIAKTTVLETLKELFGTPAACIGQQVELYEDKNVNFGGKKVSGLRVRAAAESKPAF